MKKKNKVGILLFIREKNDSNQGLEARRFSTEIRKQGLKPKVLYADLFSVFMRKNKVEIFYQEKKFNPKEYKFIIPRYSLGGDTAYNRFSLVKFLNKAGVKTFNSSQAAFLAKNKRDSLLKLAMQGINIVPTGINYSPFFLGQQLKISPSDKFVTKINSGSLGYGVNLCESKMSLISFMEFTGFNNIDSSKILIQPYVDAQAQDYRLYVVGNKVVAGMQRRAGGIDFRANISKGGSGQKIKITKAMSDLALKANKILGLDFSGVDMLKDENNNLMLLEVNCNAQLKIEKITEKNVAGEIVKYCIKKS